MNEIMGITHSAKVYVTICFVDECNYEIMGSMIGELVSLFFVDD